MASTESTAGDLLIAMHRLSRSLSQAGQEHPLQPTQLVVLAMLVGSGPCRVSTIAERVPCSQPTATSVVADLARRGFVEREADPDDRRAVLVSASELGRLTLKSVAHSRAGQLAERMNDLSEADVQVLARASELLLRLADQP